MPTQEEIFAAFTALDVSQYDFALSIGVSVPIFRRALRLGLEFVPVDAAAKISRALGFDKLDGR